MRSLSADGESACNQPASDAEVSTDRVRPTTPGEHAAERAPWSANAHHPAMDVPDDAIEPVEVLPRGDEHDDWRWSTRLLLERAHWELERADEKANTLFRLYGVILAAGVAFSVTGNSRSLTMGPKPQRPARPPELRFGGPAGCLAMGLAQRHHPKLNTALGKAPGYFGDVNAYPDTASFAGALAQTARDVDQWIVDQIRIVSAIVDRRYRLLRTATTLTWAGIVLTICAAVAQRI